MPKVSKKCWRPYKKAPSVAMANLKFAEGVLVIDGLHVKKYSNGAWWKVREANAEDVRKIPTVVD